MNTHKNTAFETNTVPALSNRFRIGQGVLGKELIIIILLILLAFLVIENQLPNVMKSKNFVHKHVRMPNKDVNFTT